MTYDRRTFLRRAGLAGAGLALGPGLAARPAAAADAGLAPFLHGVASGDPTATSVVLWTRVSGIDGPAEVRWRVARDLELADVVAAGTAVASPERDHTVKVDVTGLEPSAWWFYEFEHQGRPSLVGRTKTAPTSTQHLRFGVASCANYQGGFFNGYARLAERDDLDAILHLGDYVYEYGNGDDRYGPGQGELTEPRDHEPPTEMISLADYRGRHAQYKLDPDLRRLHQLLPFVTTWDDHESTDNSHRDGAANHTPETEGDWEVRKAASQRAYDEWMPIRVEDPTRVHRVLRYGDLADVIVLDTRLDDRDPQLGETGVTVLDGAEIDDPDRRLISDDQRAMLHDALASSTATWKVVAQQVILGQWNGGGLPQLPEGADLPQFFLRDGGNALNPDQWDGYTAERARLFTQIRDDDVDGVVVLTGDVHTSWALDLTEDPYDPTRYVPLTGEGALGVEFVTPSITSANFEILGPGAAAAETGTLADNPHVKWVDFTSHGYYVLDLTPERAQADWYFVDTVLQPSDAEVLGASWKTDAGSRHVSQAEAAAGPGTAAPATPEGSPRQVGAPAAPARPGPSDPATPARALPATGGAGTAVTGAVALGGAALVAKALQRRMQERGPTS